MIEQLGEMTELVRRADRARARRRKGRHAFREVRLDILTEDAIRRTERNHPEIPIVAELAPTSVLGQPASLERAIGNLLDNAAKWSPAGAQIEVHLDGGELTVRDHGPGIADEDVPHVFERFSRHLRARHAGLRAGPRDRPPGRGGAQRLDRGREARGRRNADAAPIGSGNGAGADS